MKYLTLYSLFESEKHFKVTLENIKISKNLRDKINHYWADVSVNGDVVGRVRLQSETINLDTRKAGKQRTTFYYNLTWDQKKAAELFGHEINNFTRRDESKFNASSSRVPWTTRGIETYIKKELDRLNENKAV